MLDLLFNENIEVLLHHNSFNYPFSLGLHKTFILISFVYFKVFIEFKHVCTCLNSSICYNQLLIIVI